jgi:hypothetical protein
MKPLWCRTIFALCGIAAGATLIFFIRHLYSVRLLEAQNKIAKGLIDADKFFADDMTWRLFSTGGYVVATGVILLAFFLLIKNLNNQ